jgi:hypothetical protein
MVWEFSSDISRRSNHDGYDIAHHHADLWKGICSGLDIPWICDGFQRSIRRNLLLSTLKSDIKQIGISLLNLRDFLYVGCFLLSTFASDKKAILTD